MADKIPDTNSSDDARLNSLIGRFLEAQEQGRAIDLQSLAAEAPDLRERFLGFVRDHDQLKRRYTGHTTTPLVHSPSPSAPPDKLEQGVVLGQELGSCRILRELGRGGMGVVYVGEHVRLKDLRAIKVMPRHKVTDGAIRRFWKEAQTAAKMNHLHIINIQDVGHEHNLHYIVMQHIDGRTLQEYLDHYLVRSEGKPLPGGTALRLMVPVLDALAAMHSQGLVHRDIKPSNIMVTGTVSRRQHVVVMDFGLVRDESDDSQSDAIVGTPAFMAQEQALGDPVDARCDLYAVGATLYYLLTARPPYEGTTGKALAQAAQGARPTPLRGLRPDLPDRFCAIVERAMEPNRDKRYARAADMLKDIGEALREVATGVTRSVPTPVVAVGSSVPKPDGPHLNATTPVQDTVARHADSSEIDASDLAADPADVPLQIVSFAPASAMSSGEQQRSIQTTTASRLDTWKRLLEQPANLLAAGVITAAVIAVGVMLTGMMFGNRSSEGDGSNTNSNVSTTSVGAAKVADRTGMVHIPKGRAYLGADPDRLRAHAQTIDYFKQNASEVDAFVKACCEEPHQVVELDGFWIDVYEVTNADYAKFVKATGHRAPVHWQGNVPPADLRNHPVTHVLHEDATAYAKWAGKELPTVAQWNRAFRGDSARMYSWGDTWERERANVLENNAYAIGTSEVGASPRDVSSFGVFNLVGNVDEIMRERVVKLGQNATIVKGSYGNAMGSIYGAAPFQRFVIGDELSLRELTGFRCVVTE